MSAAGEVDHRLLPSRPGQFFLLGRQFAVEDLLQLRFGGLDLAGADVEIGDGADDGHVLRVGGQRRLVLLLGLVHLVHGFIALGERQGGFLRRGILPAALSWVAFLGLVFLADGGQQPHQRHPRQGELRLEFHGAADRLFGVGQQALAAFVLLRLVLCRGLGLAAGRSQHLGQPKLLQVILRFGGDGFAGLLHGAVRIAHRQRRLRRRPGLRSGESPSPCSCSNWRNHLSASAGFPVCSRSWSQPQHGDGVAFSHVDGLAVIRPAPVPACPAP